MPIYQARYSVGSAVRIASRDALEQFHKNWRYHHPLSPEQLDYADQSATVREVTYYHGGDVLYQLEGVPGTWHEELLMAGAGPRAV